MAGDWLKWTRGLAKKPEVLQMAAALGRSRKEVATTCMEVWDWVNDHCTPDGIDALVPLGSASSSSVIDPLADISGFADAMASVGWLKQRNGRLAFPNFFRHNGQSAMIRARNAANQAAKRDCHQPVTDLSPTCHREPVTGQTSPHIDTHSSLNSSSEKKNTEPKKRSIFVKPTVEDVRAYCLERGNGVDAQRWMDHYQSNGWRVGKNAMSDWKAAVRTWEKNAGQFGNSPEVDSDKARKRKEAWDKIGMEDGK